MKEKSEKVKSPKVLFLHGTSSSFERRLRLPLKSVKAKAVKSLGGMEPGARSTVGSLAKKIKAQCDVLFVKDVYSKNALDLIYSLRDHGGFKVIVDVDSNFWGESAEKAIYGMESLKCADGVTVASKVIREKLAHLNSNIAITPTIASEKEFVKLAVKRSKRVKIGISAEFCTASSVQTVAKSLAWIQEKYLDGVEIIVLGTTTKFLDFPVTYKKSTKIDGLDILVVPQNPGEDVMSNLAFVECGVNGVAFLGASNASSRKFTKSVASKGTWDKAISDLVDSADKRLAVVQEAREYIKKNCSPELSWVWSDFIGKVLADTDKLKYGEIGVSVPKPKEVLPVKIIGQPERVKKSKRVKPLKKNKK